MIKRVDRYILTEIMTPLLMTLGIAAILLVLERMLRLFDFVVNQGGPVDVVWRMLGNLLPHYLGLALPIGLFLGILLAFRKLSLSSEMDAMQSCGFSLPRMVRPVMVLTLFLMVINHILISEIQPRSRYAYHGLVYDLRSGALGASIKTGEFTELPDGFTLRVEESRNNGSELIGIFAEKRSADGRRLEISAKRGSFFSTGNQTHVILRLEDGVIVDFNDTQNKPRVLTFDVQDLTINLPEVEGFRERGGEYLELTIAELWTVFNDPATDAATRAKYRANFHWRLVHTATFLVLPFLAIALGLARKRSDKSLGLVVGITSLVVFNELTEAGQSLAAQQQLSPWVSLWGLLGLFALFSWRLFQIAAFRAGGEPLGFLETLWARIRIPFDWVAERLRREMA